MLELRGLVRGILCWSPGLMVTLLDGKRIRLCSVLRIMAHVFCYTDRCLTVTDMDRYICNAWREDRCPCFRLCVTTGITAFAKYSELPSLNSITNPHNLHSYNSKPSTTSLTLFLCLNITRNPKTYPRPRVCRTSVPQDRKLRDAKRRCRSGYLLPLHGDHAG